MNRRAALASVACLIGLTGNVVCAYRHSCMAGHMEHPPFVVFDYALDAFWASCLFVAAWLAQRSEIKHPILFGALALALLPLRFFASGLVALHIPTMLIEFPIMVYVGLVSVRSIWATLKHSPHDEKMA